MSEPPTTETTHRIEVQGPLIVWASENEQGEDEIRLGGKSLSDLVAQLYGLRLTGRGSLGINGRLGRVRLTLEVL